MYKVMLIDDEIWMLNDLLNIIDWNEYGFEVAFTTVDVEEALKNLDIVKPDVICADIRMPCMNGLELVRYLKEHEYNTINILISAYGEFEYAKQALEYGAFEYILKPISLKALKGVLERAKAVLDAERSVESQFPSDNGIIAADNLSEPIAAAVEYIDLHYSEKLTVGLLAQKLHFTKVYFGNAFKKETGISINDYIALRRRTEAKRLLKNNKLSLKEISVMVGYDDYFYFSKLFRKYENMSPRDYRKKLKNELLEVNDVFNRERED